MRFFPFSLVFFRFFYIDPFLSPVAGLNPKAGLLGSTSKDAALVDQWVSFIDAEVASKFYTAMNVTRARHFPYSKPVS
jgi:elongation factor 1-gamma